MKSRILVVDDESTIRNLLKGRLEREGFEVTAAEGVDAAEAAIRQGEFDVVVTDIKMPGKDGFALLKSVSESSPSTKCVVITGHGEKEAAVKALREGAVDYLEKPFDLDVLTHSVKRAAKEAKSDRESADYVGRLEERAGRAEGPSDASGWYSSQDASMAKVNEWMSVLRRESMRGSAEEPPVLILGENGTGKEGVARGIHATSRVGKGPWIAVNCANFADQLLESELFGHERGAFTGAVDRKRGLFELADGGTLFLDEIGEMDPKLQAKLLRVLQEKTFRRVGGTADLDARVRVIAATNQDLGELVQSGKFREDLYHRINRVTIEVPPLRARVKDVVPMAKKFAERAFSSRGKRFLGFSPEAETALQAYPWPGNVRELLNVVERAALVWNQGGLVTKPALSIPDAVIGAGGSARKLELVQNGSGGYPAIKGTGGEGPGLYKGFDLSLGYMTLKKEWSDSFEKEYLVSTLTRHHGNVSAAAREAKLDRSNFLRLLRRHSLNAQAFRQGVAVPAAVAEAGEKKIA